MTYEEYTQMSLFSICQLTHRCLTATYFAYKDTLYEQREGARMGSVWTPIIDYIYMEFFETMALDKADLKLSIWYRYIDSPL